MLGYTELTDYITLLRNCFARLADKDRKELNRIFEQFGLKITAQANKKTVNFVDVTFDLSDGTYHPIENQIGRATIYISNHSNQPPSILKRLPQMISERSAAPLYNNALKCSHFNNNLHAVRPRRAF